MIKLTGFKLTIVKYIAIAVLPLAVLLVTPVTHYAVLAFGEPALLRTVPVDPRDLLRGDYVTLDYDISRISLGMLTRRLRDKIDGNSDNYADLTVYTAIELDENGVASVEGIYDAPPQKMYIKGRMAYEWNSYRVDYSIGAYFVPEGTGREIEEKIRDAAVYADVRILMGRAVIKALRFDETGVLDPEARNSNDVQETPSGGEPGE